MAEGESRIENFLVSGVTGAMLDALTALGMRWGLDGTALTVQGIWVAASAEVCRRVTLNCGNSATTLRLLAGALAAWGMAAVLDGSPGLRRRPMGRIVEPLKQMGVAINAEQGCAPLALGSSSRPLRASGLHAAGSQRPGKILSAAGCSDRRRKRS